MSRDLSKLTPQEREDFADAEIRGITRDQIRAKGKTSEAELQAILAGPDGKVKRPTDDDGESYVVGQAGNNFKTMLGLEFAASAAAISLVGAYWNQRWRL